MLKNLVKVLVLAAFLVTAVQTSALAAEGFTVVNNTEQTIIAAYFRASGDSEYGGNLLDRHVYPGETWQINFHGGRYWDCLFELDDGTSRHLNNLDVETTVHVNLH